MAKEEIEYPEVEVTLNKRSNAFSIMGAVSSALRRAGVHRTITREYRDEAMKGDNEHLLKTTEQWVKVTWVN